MYLFHCQKIIYQRVHNGEKFIFKMKSENGLQFCDFVL